MPRWGSGTRYGYGLVIREFRGVTLLEHGGSRAGYGSFIRIVPEHQLGIVVLTNLQGGHLPRTIEKICELLLPLKPSQKGSLPKAEEITSSEMQEYVGVYKNGASERVTTSVSDGRLMLRDNSRGLEIIVRDGKLMLLSGQNEVPVSKIGERRLMVQMPGAAERNVFVMLPNRKGRITYLQMGDFAFKRQE